MKITLIRAAAAALLIVTAHVSYAASMSLVPQQSNDVTVGQLVTFDVVYDFSDNALFFGGNFDIVFESDALGFVDFEVAGISDLGFARAPDILDGLLEGWSFLDIVPIDFAETVGTVTFEVLDTMGPTTSLVIRPTTITDFAGFFCSFNGDQCPEPIIFEPTVLTRVPVPGAIYLFAGALIALRRMTRNAT